MYRRSNDRSRRFSDSGARTRGGKSRGRASRGDDLSSLTSSFGRLSVTPSDINIPPLSCFAFGDAAITGSRGSTDEAEPKATSIPDNYASARDYLKAMQAHTYAEFKASIKEGVVAADRKERGGWLPMTRETVQDGKRFFHVDGTPQDKNNRDSGHNFRTDPWSRHLVQLEGRKDPALAVACKYSSDHQATLSLFMPAKGSGYRGIADHDTRVRSLGYVGSFLREYDSAARLLLSNVKDNMLLKMVSSPGHQIKPGGGSFVPATAVGNLDTSRVPLNTAQRDAVLKLTGVLDIIVGPPGTGKSTTIYHIIDARVTQDSRILVTSIRNQAVEAVTTKVANFGVLVFGSENRLGKDAREFTMEGRLRNDPELVFWRGVRDTWTQASSTADNISWENLHLPNFPGITRLEMIEWQGLAAKNSSRIGKQHHDRENLEKKGRAAGRWAYALKRVLRETFESRLARGNAVERQKLKELRSLEKWKRLLSTGRDRSARILTRLEDLTRYRLYTTTRVLICTVDSTERMLRMMEEGTAEAALAVGKEGGNTPQLQLDTVIMDEAACVLETAVPVLLALKVKNLTLVGDQHQLQPFSRVREQDAGRNHTRSLMERAINAGARSQFLDTQYRMHPKLCQVISETFYSGKLSTANETKNARLSSLPCRWIHVSGGEVKHNGRGYSNAAEAKKVAAQARSALKRYGAGADVRVITFYNMQKRELESEFENQRDISHITISSVDACQGSDADVIIVSTVRSDCGDDGYRLSGFMIDPRRVNVALSRAKEECIVVGDKHTLRAGGGAMWQNIVNHFTS